MFLIVKIILLITVFLVSTAIGFFISNRFSERVRELEDLITALELFETKISYTYDSLIDTFTYISENLKTIIESVDATKSADFRLSFDPTLVRGMSYYTGPIFEISMDEFGGSVGGGGRYDEMIGKFTGKDTCACGFSIGFERIVMLLLERDYKVPQKKAKTAYLVEKNMPSDKMLKILAKAKAEREAGAQINISIMKKNKKFQKDQMMLEGYEEFVEFFKDKEI